MDVPAVKVKNPRLSFAILAEFGKLRLAFLVVVSAVICYCISARNPDWFTVLVLTIGGFLVTASSNGYNQIIERHLDKKMSRTCGRPLPSGRMSLFQAQITALLTGLAGIALLLAYINVLSALLGTIALLLYTLVYTPLKQQTPFAVFIGAFPGAIPPLLGCVAATNEISVNALILFSIQFLWQFPHFWAIAWKLDDDYLKAGFRLLPSPDGRSKNSAFQVVIYTLALVPVSLMPYVFNMSGTISLYVILLTGLVFSYQAIRLYVTCEMKAATHLMFGSFLYLPLVQLAILFDRL